MDYRKALAIGDIIDESKKRVPILRSINYKYKKEAKFDRQNSSDILPRYTREKSFASITSIASSDKSVDLSVGATSKNSYETKTTSKRSVGVRNALQIPLEETEPFINSVNNPFRDESRNVDSVFNLPESSSRLKLLEAVTLPQTIAARKKGEKMTVDGVLAQALSFMNEAK